MTSRERVLTTLRHEEPDRVPVDLGGMRSTGIMAIAYVKLREHLGLPAEVPRVYDATQQLAEPHLDLLEHFDVDVIDLENSLGHWGEWQPWALPDGTPCEMPAKIELERDGNDWYIVKDGIRTSYMPANSLYFDGIHWPLADAEGPEDFDRLAPETWLTDEYLIQLRDRAEWLNANTDFAIMGRFGGNILELGQGLRGWDQFLLDLALGGEFVEGLLAWMTERWLENLELYLDAVGSSIHLIQMGDDLGLQDRSQVSPHMYRELIKPYHQRIYEYVHEHSDVYVFLHSCGSIYELIPDLIDAGVDVLNPVQISAAEMEPARLKAEFGDQLVFWGGGCDTQRVLPFSTPEEVTAHVREQVNTFKPGGGYVFCQVHNIQADVPPENIVAMYEALSAAG